MRATRGVLYFLKSAVLIANLVPAVIGQDDYSATFNITEDANGCTTMIRYFNPLIHKPKYTVGIYSSEGDEETYNFYNLTFAKYLTETAGRKFDPPLEFEIVVVNLDELMKLADEDVADFFFADPSVTSCMATTYKAQPLVTLISHRDVRGHEYDLDLYGGVMFTLAGNKEVNSIEDFKDRIIAAGSITNMGGAQSQFYEMFKAGLSFVADPKQVIFTHNEQLTVQGVLNGDFEIGFTRTDQIERTLDANGNLLDPDTFKVISPRTHVMEDGRLFPFLSSTSLHPEWAVAALDHVSKDVSQEVQEALLALRDHATELELHQNLRCDTTPELAELAVNAKTSGLYTGFRTARDYFLVRTAQEADGFLLRNEDGDLYCIHGKTLYQDIHCPDHHYKVTEEEFDKSCEVAGLECKEGYTCFCKPCVESFEVDVFQYVAGSMTDTHGCEKMSLCGTVEQTKAITFRIIDHVERVGATVTAIMHMGQVDSALPVKEVAPFTYEIRWSEKEVGIAILEIGIDGVQIPESPIRVQTVERQCDVDYPGQGKEAAEDGTCQCGDDSVEVGGNCVDKAIFAIVGSIGALLIAAIIGYFYMGYKNRKADEIWMVNVDELHFDEPVEVIGQGSFGVVLLAEYRGTKVAIKRALMSGGKSGSTKVSRKGVSGSLSYGATAKMSGEVEVVSDDGTMDIESQPRSDDATRSRESSILGGGSKKASDEISLGFLAEDFGKKSKWAWLFPWLAKDTYRSQFKEAILGNSTTSSSKSMLAGALCPWFNEKARRQEEFVTEMRVLARLRHPCITTVMGAVISNTHDPMLVMEHMEYGSLHDLLRNETMYLSGEIIIQILRDIAQGMRFLHSSKPPILHGDLKARNILVDARFRAKICDFGLSTKKKNSITGTPFWMAPEYLRGQTQYNANCDMYSVGIIFNEMYSRKAPYEGDDFREVLRGVCNRRVNKRPSIPATTPPKMVDLMKKCWSPDPFFRPQAKDLDMVLMDMCAGDAEPLTTEQQAARTKAPTTDMLYEIFPKHIADALKAGKKVEAEQHDLVTVVFSDIVNFTDISRDISPLKVSTMLDRLYLAIDKLARQHHVFKVETIGDAYMGVTNLEADQEDSHVKHIAEFAIDMVNEASKILIDEEEPSKGYINIRAGFHSGPVVSNVIGSLNPRYGLFGDTVNTASRMESNSVVNRILCSDRAYKLLKEQAPGIPVKKRGKINVKGKGDMNVYWIGDSVLAAKRNKVPVEYMVKRVGFEADDSESQVAGV